MKFYVYMYYDLVAKEPFWVGKGKNRRYEISQHFNGHNNYTLKNRLKSLGEDNIRIQFIYRTDDEKICLEREIYWISKIGRKDLGVGPLLNLTDGGEGNNWWLGKTGENHPLYGKHQSKENNLKNAIANGAHLFYILKNGEIIAEYINQSECGRDFNLNRGHISNCLKQKLKYHKGYTFKYVEDFL